VKTSTQVTGFGADLSWEVEEDSDGWVQALPTSSLVIGREGFYGVSVWANGRPNPSVTGTQGLVINLNGAALARTSNNDPVSNRSLNTTTYASLNVGDTLTTRVSGSSALDGVNGGRWQVVRLGPIRWT